MKLVAIPKKKTTPVDTSDFRPISQLCTLSEVTERVLFNQISDYINKHVLLDVHQFGIRKNHSTSTTFL